MVLTKKPSDLSKYEQKMYQYYLGIVANFAYICIYIQPKEYIMWWRRSNIIYWQPYGALQWQERKRANWLDDIWRVTPLLQYHYFLFLNVFSHIHCWYLDKVADKRNVVIFACQPRIDHFIRQFSKKPAGYMCYTFFLFHSLQKQFIF